MRHLFIAASVLALAACNISASDENDEQTTQAEPASDNLADSMASNDDRYLNEIGDDAASDPSQSSDIRDSEERPIMQAQVVLDRIGFGPGVIDGKMGMSTENALTGFQQAKGLEVTGKLDEQTRKALADWQRIPATRVVRIPDDWANQGYTDIPEDTAEKAKLERLGYKSLDERLAERFHTTIETLEMLNPGGKPAGSGPDPDADATSSPSPTPSADKATPGMTKSSKFAAGQMIRVPNIGADKIKPGAIESEDWQRTLASLGVGSEQPEVDRIVVSKAGKTLEAYQGEKLVALFTVSSGSSEFPLPLGEWDILGEAYNPPYSYDPEVLGQGEGKEYQLPPGPNGLVGVVWIDLSKEHYGIHGTPDPETIGRAQSSGCVRLTNWDAARLAQMVSQSTKVEFVA